jgi:sec-independent protein translocase protein TatB
MFDIGFMEMALIGVVALVVIGPERLPGVARTVGQWVGSARRFMSSVQADINLEVNKADTLKQLLEEQTKIQSVHEILEQTPIESDDRKPVPRAVAAKPEYLVKAINDEPTADDDNTASSSSSSGASSNKHD